MTVPQHKHLFKINFECSKIDFCHYFINSFYAGIGADVLLPKYTNRNNSYESSSGISMRNFGRITNSEDIDSHYFRNFRRFSGFLKYSFEKC